MEKDESYEYWLRRLSKLSIGTRISYKAHLRQFCDWIGKSPDVLIEERSEELKSEDPRVQNTKEDELLDYLVFLKEERELKPKTLRMALTAAKSFFANNYVPLNIPSNLTPSSRITTNRRAITKAELKKVIELTNIKWKALLLTLRDTGLRISDAIKLQMKHINDLEGEPPIHIREITTEKDGSQPITFLGSESIAALKDWIEFRKRGTRHVYGGDKGLPPESITSESYLFITQNGAPLKVGNASRMIINQMERAGLTGLSAHSLRKYFQTQLESAGVPRNWILRMMGKSLPGSDGSYSMPSELQLREAYERAYPQLAILPITNTERVTDLEEEVKSLKSELGRFENIRTILANPREWLQKSGDYPPDGLTEDEFYEWMSKRYGDPRIEVLDDADPALNPDLAKKKKIDAELVPTNDEEKILELVKQGYEISSHINGKVLLKRINWS